jgi:hypothetical protein
MKKNIIGILILSTWIISTAYCDELSRQKYEAAHAAYELELSARLLDQTVKDYSPITNPNGGATVLTAFDQLANKYLQASLPIGNLMNTVKQAYPQPHPFHEKADTILQSLNQAVTSVSLLQTVSRGAVSANLSSKSYLSDITDVVSHAGAITYVSTVITNLVPSGISADELNHVQEKIYEKVYPAASAAINRKAGGSDIIANSDACLAATGAIATLAMSVEGAIALAMEQYVYQSIPFSNGFTASLDLILEDPKKNPLSMDKQQESYATTFNAIFATTFSALLNQNALQPYQTPVYKNASQTNAEVLIDGAHQLAAGISQMIMPDMSTNIVDAMNYAGMLNSGLLDKRHFELRDLIFVMQELSGVIQ